MTSAALGPLVTGLEFGRGNADAAQNLVSDDGIFDTTLKRGKGPRRSYDIFDTAGCSCEQIVEELGLGNGHLRFGCSIGAMDNWINQVSQ